MVELVARKEVVVMARKKLTVHWRFKYSSSISSTKSADLKEKSPKLVKEEDQEPSLEKNSVEATKSSANSDGISSLLKSRKALAPWRFRPCQYRLHPREAIFSEEVLQKSSKLSFTCGEKSSGSQQIPQDRIQNRARGGKQAKGLGNMNSSAEKSSLASSEEDSSEKPRRYPSRVRTSATTGNSSRYEAVHIKETTHEEMHNGNDEAESLARKRKRNEPQHESNKKGSLSDVASPTDQAAWRPNDIGMKNDVATSKEVKKCLDEFRSIYGKLMEEESSPRRDLVAFRLLREKYNGLNDGTKYLGPVPGTSVGYACNFRVELHIIGLHRQQFADIDSIFQGEKNIAISIVSMMRLGDAGSLSDIFEYTCYGLPNEGVKLYGRHLALKNSIDSRAPVRVIYGFVNYCPKLKAKRFPTYIYDGLYIVEKLTRKKSKDDQYIFTFRLRRMPDQPKVNIKEILKLSSDFAIYIADFSEGKEKIPISLVNDVDDEGPPAYKYITKLLFPSQHLLSPFVGCDCVNGCSDSVKCACSVKNGGELPFNSDGAILHAKPLVYECGPSCKCSLSCHNRVSQHGIKFRLQIFKTKSMGWGVRSLDFIPSGSFVCEYVGEMLKDEEADERATDDYLFSVGKNYYDESLWEGLSSSIPALEKAPSCKIEEIGFTIDTSKCGNVGRFINHNCTPNLYAQNLLNDHEEISMPRIMFFASEDIPPLQELSYHYNYTIGSVRDSNGNIKKKYCYCGSFECTGRLY